MVKCNACCTCAIAGKYGPHTDYITGKDQMLNPLERKRGNRISTLMVYLENVISGGYTGGNIILNKISKLVI